MEKRVSKYKSIWRHDGTITQHLMTIRLRRQYTTTAYNTQPPPPHQQLPGPQGRHQAQLVAGAIWCHRYTLNRTDLSRSCYRTFRCSLRNVLQIALNRTEIKSYSPCTDWFGTANGRCPFVIRINRKMVCIIWFRFDLLRFQKYFSVCRCVLHE